MGRKYGEVAHEIELVPYEVVKAKKGMPLFIFEMEIDGVAKFTIFICEDYSRRLMPMGPIEGIMEHGVFGCVEPPTRFPGNVQHQPPE